MKRSIVLSIMFLQLIGLVAAGFARADIASLVTDENTTTVRTCSGLLGVVFDNTVDSMRTIAEIAGLVQHPVKPQKAPPKPVRDGASAPAIIMQAPKTAVDARSGLPSVVQPIVAIMPAVTDTGQCVFLLMLLLFTGLYLSLYRRRLFYAQILNSIDHFRSVSIAFFAPVRFLADRGFYFRIRRSGCIGSITAQHKTPLYTSARNFANTARLPLIEGANVSKQ